MQQAKRRLSQRLLRRVEAWGNTLPHPTMLFIYLCFLVIGVSWIGHYLGLSAIHPVNGEQISVVNLFNAAGLHQILGKMVSNFMTFAPVGPVLVAMLGLGIAERSGLIQTALRLMVMKAPTKFLTFIVVLAGVLSSIAVDSGYVVMIPMAGVIFLAAGRHPLAGIAACFAGVSGGFSANLLVGPFDAILGGISTEAARLIDSNYDVTATANYYFIVVSTLLISVVATWVTERFISPMLGEYRGAEQGDLKTVLTSEEQKGLKGAFVVGLVIVVGILWGLIPEQGLLRDPVTGGIIKSPFMSGLIALIALSAALMGITYGKLSGCFKTHVDVIKSMEKSMEIMATYIVLMFFAAQFVNYFNWTNLGLILAINGADTLKNSGLGAVPLMLGFIFFCTFANLFIGSASAKWAIMAPVFIPMFMLMGVAPEVVQAAYRVGDSSTNIITPLMPYFALVFAFMKRYDDKVGVGTIMTLMLPYSVAFLLSWGLLLSLWLMLGIPLGPGASLFLAIP
ncbi:MULTISPECIES: AbgT family transporter [Cycloclasticus]|jgi:aminobenzoyl-glutamate transport protein|uniref:AbgT family transporter n=1 Tax=Cycloclasticus TaxID=34067 RepID=UPI000286AD47|nr:MULTISPECIES: AbgT family transporter [Cycloclasticus]AFT66966.1 P-aminobenzoyl-glutamate transporter family, permease protein [Cycloclasticus sp. P1]SHJ31018.1 aminobenzoyl-glutamate transport protein [Cycloclasticus pugetii]|tara:strand:- start:380 stop:1906 length:1527 start_codon:yes stop_codon:yes gene_type:complete